MATASVDGNSGMAAVVVPDQAPLTESLAYEGKEAESYRETQENQSDGTTDTETVNPVETPSTANAEGEMNSFGESKESRPEDDTPPSAEPPAGTETSPDASSSSDSLHYYYRYKYGYIHGQYGANPDESVKTEGQYGVSTNDAPTTDGPKTEPESPVSTEGEPAASESSDTMSTTEEAAPTTDDMPGGNASASEEPNTGNDAGAEEGQSTPAAEEECGRQYQYGCTEGQYGANADDASTTDEPTTEPESPVSTESEPATSESSDTMSTTEEAAPTTDDMPGGNAPTSEESNTGNDAANQDSAERTEGESQPSTTEPGTEESPSTPSAEDECYRQYRYGCVEGQYGVNAYDDNQVPRTTEEPTTEGDTPSDTPAEDMSETPAEDMSDTPAEQPEGESQPSTTEPGTEESPSTPSAEDECYRQYRYGCVEGQYGVNAYDDNQVPRTTEEPTTEGDTPSDTPAEDMSETPAEDMSDTPAEQPEGESQPSTTEPGTEESPSTPSAEDECYRQYRYGCVEGQYGVNAYDDNQVPRTTEEPTTEGDTPSDTPAEDMSETPAEDMSDTPAEQPEGESQPSTTEPGTEESPSTPPASDGSSYEYRPTEGPYGSDADAANSADDRSGLGESAANPESDSEASSATMPETAELDNAGQPSDDAANPSDAETPSRDRFEEENYVPTTEGPSANDSSSSTGVSVLSVAMSWAQRSVEQFGRAIRHLSEQTSEMD